MIELLKVHPFFSDKNIESCTLLQNQGYCNENYLVVADGVKYIVRKLLRDDIDRDFEYSVHKLAFDIGITCESFVYDVTNKFMVFEFLEGMHQSKLSKQEIKNLSTVMKSLHDIKIDAKLIIIDINNQSDEVIQAFNTIDRYPREYVLCHNDLNPQNIFFSDEVKLIDWEYAGVNDRYFDLACVCVEFELNDEMQRVFLDAYFPDKYALEKLEAYKVFYKALCEEWFDALR